MDGSRKPELIVPIKYAMDKAVRLRPEMLKRGSVKALKPEVWPGMLIITPMDAKGKRNQP